MQHALATTRRATVFAFVLASLLAAFARPAFAAAPANDTYGGRVTVGALPYTATLDTSEATADADDADINAGCGAPATDASVWYQVTAATDTGLVADVSSSSYSAGAIVATGSPGAWNVLACAPGTVGWSAVAGETYTILVIDDQLDGGGNGGTLNLTIDTTPPPPSVHITVDPVAKFFKDGSALVSGTVNCTGQADFAFVDTFLSQKVGRFIISGESATDIACDGVTRPWSVQVVASNGVFKGGKAATVTFTLACGTFDCGFDFVERTVLLKGSSS